MGRCFLVCPDYLFVLVHRSRVLTTTTFTTAIVALPTGWRPSGAFPKAPLFLIPFDRTGSREENIISSNVVPSLSPRAFVTTPSQLYLSSALFEFDSPRCCHPFPLAQRYNGDFQGIAKKSGPRFLRLHLRPRLPKKRGRRRRQNPNRNRNRNRLGCRSSGRTTSFSAAPRSPEC